MDAIDIRELVSKYDQELVRFNYRPNTLKSYRGFLKRLLTYFDSRQESIFSEEIAVQFLEDRYGLLSALKTRELTRNETYLRQLVRKLVLFHLHGSVERTSRVPLQSVKTEKLASILGLYEEACLRRGYARSTRRSLRLYAVRLFTYLESHSILHPSGVTSQMVGDYVNSLRGYSYHSVGLALICLRNLLAFLHAEGYHPEDLSEAVPQQQARNDSKVPATWFHEDVLTLLTAIDRGNPCGKRDYAIMLLVTRLGLRAGDVRNLKLQNLKWPSNRIEFVQSKTSQVVSLPLLKDVGWAIIDYLKHGRPVSDSPFVFLSHKAPYQGLGDGNCFYYIISRCMRVTRTTASLRQKVGMHSLRHTLATTLLEKQTPLSTIAGILGHASVESTAVYLKTDVDALRACALESLGGEK